MSGLYKITLNVVSEEDYKKAAEYNQDHSLRLY